MLVVGDVCLLSRLSMYIHVLYIQSKMAMILVLSNGINHLPEMME